MNGYLLHEFVAQLKAPLRERAAHQMAQREIALRIHQRPVGFALRLDPGRTLIGLGRIIQGAPAASAHSLGDSANAAT